MCIKKSHIDLTDINKYMRIYEISVFDLNIDGIGREEL